MTDLQGPLKVWLTSSNYNKHVRKYIIRSELNGKLSQLQHLCQAFIFLLVFSVKPILKHFFASVCMTTGETKTPASFSLNYALS